MAYDFDLVVIGGGPAGYAAAIRASQLGKKVLCVEKDKLGGICLNWGCIPTKALLTNAHLVELINRHGKAFGWTGQSSWDFGQMIGRSRTVASNLNKGIEGLFRKYKVASKFGTAKVTKPNTVQVGAETVTADKILIATGVRPRPLPGAEFDGKQVISYKEAMSLPAQPKSMLIIGGGPIGLEFGYFYNAIGTKVTLVELLDRILPGEDEEVSIALRKSLEKRGMTILTQAKTGKVEKGPNGVKVEVQSSDGKTSTIEADVMLVSIGVLANVEGLFDAGVGVELVKGHIKADPKNAYATTAKGIYAVGDVIGPPWLAHVAHHEAICCIESLFSGHPRTVDYTNIPGCTYTDPGRRQRRLDREGCARDGSRDPDRQISLHRQRPGPGVGRDRRVRQAHLRRRARRVAGGAPAGVAGHRTNRRTRDGQEARSDRGRDHPRHAPAPDVFRGDHGSGRAGFERVGPYLKARSTTMSDGRRSHLRPGVELLEVRELLSTVAKNVPTSFLFTPIVEGTPLAEHIHPDLTIIIDGQNVPIPTGIGLGPNGNLPIHTHDSSGIIHIESTKLLPFRLRDFFTIWGQPFSKNDILGNVANKTHKVTMTVDGRPSNAYGSLLLQDLQDVVIQYGPTHRK